MATFHVKHVSGVDENLKKERRSSGPLVSPKLPAEEFASKWPHDDARPFSGKTKPPDYVLRRDLSTKKIDPPRAGRGSGSGVDQDPRQIAHGADQNACVGLRPPGLLVILEAGADDGHIAETQFACGALQESALLIAGFEQRDPRLRPDDRERDPGESGAAAYVERGHGWRRQEFHWIQRIKNVPREEDRAIATGHKRQPVGVLVHQGSETCQEQHRPRADRTRCKSL